MAMMSFTFNNGDFHFYLGKWVLPGLLVISFFFSSILAFAENVWQIGKNDGYDCEFDFQEQEFIYYQIPLDWEERINESKRCDKIWGSFPRGLYDYHIEENTFNVPKELRINYHYSQNYLNVSLVIEAMISERGEISLKVYKGLQADEVSLIGRKSVAVSYDYGHFEFPFGPITQGDGLEENTITIRCVSPSSPYLYIKFDTIYLKEIEENDPVNDPNNPDQVDPNTWCLLVQSDDPEVTKEICVKLTGSEGPPPSLSALRFKDPNSYQSFRSDRYLPYGIIEIIIENLDPQKTLSLDIIFEDVLSSGLMLHAYHDLSGWQEVDYQLVDETAVNLALTDGGKEDYDERVNGSITSTLAFSYRKGLDIELRNEDCFLGAMSK